MPASHGLPGGIAHAPRVVRDWRNGLVDKGLLPRTVPEAAEKAPGALAAAKRWLFGDH
jgi:hypothetical protein